VLQVCLCKDDGFVMTISEYVKRGSALEYMKRLNQEGRRRPPILQIVYMVLDVASGLAHLHKTNVTHRNLALRNVMVQFDLFFPI